MEEEEESRRCDNGDGPIDKVQTRKRGLSSLCVGADGDGRRRGRFLFVAL